MCAFACAVSVESSHPQCKTSCLPTYELHSHQYVYFLYSPLWSNMKVVTGLVFLWSVCSMSGWVFQREHHSAGHIPAPRPTASYSSLSTDCNDSSNNCYRRTEAFFTWLHSGVGCRFQVFSSQKKKTRQSAYQLSASSLFWSGNWLEMND